MRNVHYCLIDPRVQGNAVQLQKMHPGQLDFQSWGFCQDFHLTMYTALGVGMGKTGKAEVNGDIRQWLSGQCVFADGSHCLIYNCSKKGSHFFNGYRFWSLIRQGKRWDVYRVGFGRRAIYLCVYIEGTLSVIYSMDMQESHFESGYTVYALDAILPEELAILGVYLDMLLNPPGDSARKSHALTTFQKELKSKFDPNFIRRMEGQP